VKEHKDMRLLRVLRGPVVLASAGALAAGLLAGCSGHAGNTVEKVRGGPSGTYVVASGIHKIKHVIIVMQENRSFDSYFGTYPGAVGIPMKNGVSTVCVPNPKGGCTRAYHDTADVNGGGPHGVTNAVADINGGKMNGFIAQRDKFASKCKTPNNPICSVTGTTDVMGYHTAAELPNYWAYARNFVLDDHMYEPVKSWSLPDHLYMVSAWSAKCTTPAPMSCTNNIGGPYKAAKFEKLVRKEVTTGQTKVDLAWTDITWLLSGARVSWAYYVQKGTQPERQDTRHLEPAAAVHRRSPGQPAVEHQGSVQLLRGGQGGQPARGELGHPVQP
jgi:phospholipase C